jgi:hypothetical protein
MIAGLLLFSAGLSQAQLPAQNGQYKVPGGSKVVLSSVGTQGESRVEFFNPSGKRLCTADYTSADGSHGYYVAKAEWTPDKHFFVFSLESSGGHSVMNTPTQFFSLREQSLCSLDSYVGGYGIEFADFGLRSPNTVEVRVNAIDAPVRVSLSSLATKAPSSEHGCVPCKAGAVHIFGDRTPYQHSPN